MNPYYCLIVFWAMVSLTASCLLFEKELQSEQFDIGSAFCLAVVSTIVFFLPALCVLFMVWGVGYLFYLISQDPVILKMFGTAMLAVFVLVALIGIYLYVPWPSIEHYACNAMLILGTGGLLFVAARITKLRLSS